MSCYWGRECMTFQDMDLPKYISLLTWIFLSEKCKGEIKILLHGKDINDFGGENTVKIIEDQTLLLECTHDIPDASVVWRGNTGVISSSSSLEISRIRIQDEGYYNCEISHTQSVTYEISVDKKSVYVQILYPPSHPDIDIPKSVLQGEKLLLTCSVEAKPDPTYKWRLDAENGSLLWRNETYTLTADSSVIVFCIVQNRMTPTYGKPVEGYVTSKISITVHRKAYITLITPGPSTTKQVGNNVYLNCYADGFPVPTIWWTKTGDKNFHRLGRDLDIYNIQRSSAGYYVCNIENTVFPKNQTAMTTHTTKIIHVIVDGYHDSSPPEEICSDCLKDIPTEIDNHSKPVIIGLAIAVGTGWFVFIISVLINVYLFKKTNQTTNKANYASNGAPANYTDGQAQSTTSAYYDVRAVGSVGNPYDEIISGSGNLQNSSTIWRDTGSVSTQTSVATYTE